MSLFPFTPFPTVPPEPRGFGRKGSPALWWPSGCGSTLPAGACEPAFSKLHTQSINLNHQRLLCRKKLVPVICINISFFS